MDMHTMDYHKRSSTFVFLYFLFFHSFLSFLSSLSFLCFHFFISFLSYHLTHPTTTTTTAIYVFLSYHVRTCYLTQNLSALALHGNPTASSSTLYPCGRLPISPSIQLLPQSAAATPWPPPLQSCP